MACGPHCELAACACGNSAHVGYFLGSPAHLQAADTLSVVLMMQILVEQSLLTAVGLEWTGLQGTEPLPAAPASHLALRNHALLVHRAEVDAAAAELTCSTTSLSGQHAQQMLNKLCVGSHTPV